MNQNDGILKDKLEPYEERFIKEKNELFERIVKLDRMLHKYANGALDFTPKCPFNLLMAQLRAMQSYYEILNQRSVIEGIYSIEYMMAHAKAMNDIDADALDFLEEK